MTTTEHTTHTHTREQVSLSVSPASRRTHTSHTWHKRHGLVGLELANSSFCTRVQLRCWSTCAPMARWRHKPTQLILAMAVVANARQMESQLSRHTQHAHSPL